MRIPAWVADLVTSARIALAPLFLLAAEATRDAGDAGAPTSRLRALTVLLLVAIAASDKVDGYLARRSASGPSRRGAMLDAAADRLIQWSGGWFFALRAAPVFTALPLWFPLALLARDGILLLVWILRRRGPVSVEHEIHGKVATALIFGVLVGAAAGLPSPAVVAAATIAVSAVSYSTSRYVLRLRAPGASGS